MKKLFDIIEAEYPETAKPGQTYAPLITKTNALACLLKTTTARSNITTAAVVAVIVTLTTTDQEENQGRLADFCATNSTSKSERQAKERPAMAPERHQEQEQQRAIQPHKRRRR